MPLVPLMMLLQQLTKLRRRLLGLTAKACKRSAMLGIKSTYPQALIP